MALIVVVDDDISIRNILREALVLSGHTVLEAADGDACIRHLKTAHPNAVITDIFMPEKDGIETICEIHERWPDIKIIAMSSGGSRPEAMDYLRAAEGLGADRILHKPFSLKQVIEVVNDLLTTEKQLEQTVPV